MKPWVAHCARAGFAARALVYATIGVLAAQVAIGAGGRTTDAHGAIEEIGSGTFGEILLVLVAIGLAGYALWRFVQSIADTEGKGSDMKGLAVRAGYMGSGLLNAGLAFAAVRLLLGSHDGEHNVAREWAARLLAAPMGPTLVMVAGGVVIAGGLYQFYKAFSEKFRKRLKTAEMEHITREWGMRISKIGLSARGAVYTLCGIYLLLAGIDANPRKAEDVQGTLREVGSQPYGDLLLGLLALGFIAYAGYALINACYRRINTAS
jgi:hypothetical protein